MAFATYSSLAGVGHLRFGRPERANAMNAEFWREFPRALASCAADPRIRVLLLSAEGKHFCAGMDLDAFACMEHGRLEVEGARWRANFRKNLLAAQDIFSRLEALRVPVIAVVQGGCFGAAVDLLCACDIRYASRDAFFVVSETNIGLTPDAGTLPRLTRLMPEGIVRELIFSGRRMSSEEAERYGFVNRSFDDADTALVAAMELAAEIGAKSPNAILGSKEMLNFGREHTTSDTLRYIAAWQAGMISFDDIHSAIAAQRAKKAAEYDDIHWTDDLFAAARDQEDQ